MGDNGKNGDNNGKIGVTRGHQTSHDFWGRQNCSPPRAPITHTTPLIDVIILSYLAVGCLVLSSPTPCSARTQSSQNSATITWKSTAQERNTSRIFVSHQIRPTSCWKKLPNYTEHIGSLYLRPTLMLCYIFTSYFV